jgi:hypothetical protein
MKRLAAAGAEAAIASRARPARIAHHHFQFHQIRLRSEMELRRRVSVRADADLVGVPARRSYFGISTAWFTAPIFPSASCTTTRTL